MTTRGADPVFVGTSILVYAAEQQAPDHDSALRVLQTVYDSGAETWISRQSSWNTLPSAAVLKLSPVLSRLTC